MVEDLKALAPVEALAVAGESLTGYPEVFVQKLGAATWRSLGDHFGLRQFGVSHETLQPGALSSLRHSHSLSEEFVYMLTGELVLRTRDGEFTLLPGMCMGFAAGDGNAHHLVNRSAAPAQFIVVGTRVQGDAVDYPEDDLRWDRTTGALRALHKDGHPYGQ
jgi:uncharacterized cupin superfamily protein